MSYLTKYDLHFYRENDLELSIEDRVSYESAIVSALATINPQYFDFGREMDLSDCLMDAMKWYSYETDICNLSKKFPELRFELYGEGEESWDIWIEYFVNGKCQKCYIEIKYPPFNPKELRNPR